MAKKKSSQAKKSAPTAEDKAYAGKKTSRTTWIVAIVISLIAIYFLAEPYIGVILFSTLAAVLFNGVYHGLLERFDGKRGRAALLVSLWAVLVALIPLAVIGFLAFNQAMSFINSLQLGDLGVSEGFSLEETISSIVDGINSISASLIDKPNLVNVDQVTGFVENAVPEVLQTLVDIAVGVFRAVPSLVMNSIIFFFVFTGLLVNQENIAKRLKWLSPFSKDLNEKLATRAIMMSGAMLKGQLIIAFLQGLVGAGSLAIVGFGEYFVFFLLIFTLLNMIPLGSGIILIPLGIIMIPFGFVWQGLLILGTHFLITTNIDNVLRPKFVPTEAWIPASVTIISALGGVALFGLLGVIYGPIIAILIMTILEAYTDEQKEEALASS